LKERKMHLLEIKNLSTQFFTYRGVVPAVSDVGFDIDKGKVVAIVGESGSGKSVTAFSIVRLVSPPGRIVEGSIMMNGKNLLELSERDIQKVRGKDISMIFQEPMTSLNPVMTCGGQIREVLSLHSRMTKAEQTGHIVELFKMVGIPEPESRLNEYPHELSGGLRQRVMIAMALACNPQLLIADEPTTALDVTIQAQILDLLKNLQKKTGMSVLLITHDFGVVAEMADDVIVMYTGRVMERAAVDEILRKPLHPYTQGLLRSIPSLDDKGKNSGERLFCIDGTVPSLLNMPEGCSFSPRCEKAMDICREKAPGLIDAGNGHKVCCWLYEGGQNG